MQLFFFAFFHLLIIESIRLKTGFRLSHLCLFDLCPSHLCFLMRFNPLIIAWHFRIRLFHLLILGELCIFLHLIGTKLSLQLLCVIILFILHRFTVFGHWFILSFHVLVGQIWVIDCLFRLFLLLLGFLLRLFLLLALLELLSQLVEHVCTVGVDLGRWLVVLRFVLPLCLRLLFVASFLLFQVSLRVRLLILFILLIFFGLNLIILQHSLVAFLLHLKIILALLIFINLIMIAAFQSFSFT